MGQLRMIPFGRGINSIKNWAKARKNGEERKLLNFFCSFSRKTPLEPDHLVIVHTQLICILTDKDINVEN